MMIVLTFGQEAALLGQFWVFSGGNCSFFVARLRAGMTPGRPLGGDRVRELLWVALGTALVLGGGEASAQSYVQPSANWNGSWGFPTTAEKTYRLLQADTIEKKEEDYYSSIGRNTINYNATNNTWNDNRSGMVEFTANGDSKVDISNRTSNDIGQNTNVIGSVNAPQTSIDISGSGNSVRATNTSDSSGCLDGSVTISSGTTTGSSLSCN